MNIKSLFFIVCTSFFTKSIAAECGYKSCNPAKIDQINIHLIPHSHDDLGYLKTVEQYYYGAHDDFQQAGVQYILDSVVEALQKNSNRRFVQVETGFFWKWWLEQDDETRKTVKNLVNNGQLEFIGGGWAMNDEATTYYQTIIDQMSWGLRKLNETFGECGRPRVSWQIDPFGHSREMASIFAQMGYDGFFLNRIDYQDLAQRSLNGSLEFIWRGNPDNLGESSDIYTNVLFRHYKNPSGLCFDVKCNDEPVIDNPNSIEYNVNTKAENFINDWVLPALKGYASNNVLVPMGDDFHYQYAGKYYKNMDKLIRYINSHEFNGTKFNVLYSTPSCYLKAVYLSTNGTLNASVKTDDFFPYASSEHNYWTGYYSSRPTGKGYSRHANNFLQICKQLSSFSNITSPDDARLNTLRESLATFQHHDGITGTEREHVAHDYIRMLHDGMSKCEEIVNVTLFHLIKSTNMTFTTCPMLNISECVETETRDQLIITVYNPLGRPVNKFLKLPIAENISTYSIRDPSGEVLTTQIVGIHPSFLNIPGRKSTAKYLLIFKAVNIPALGFKSYYFERQAGRKNDIDALTSNLKRHTIDIALGIDYSFLYYHGYNGNYTSEDFSPSQPYVFRSDPDNPITVAERTTNDVLYDGPLVTEIHRTYGDWLSHIDRAYIDNNAFINELVYLAGPLPYEKQGVEVVLRYSFDTFDHDGSFYTDTNGRGSIHRIRDYRPTWNASVAEPEAGNYYPVASKLYIKSVQKDLDITVFTDRGLGATSPNNTEIEFMIHRNTMSGGPGALAEPLNEQAYGSGVVTTGSLYFDIRDYNYTTKQAIYTEETAQNISLDSWMFFASPNGLSFENYQERHVMEFSALKTPVPRNGHVLTLEPWGPSKLLLRLENFIGNDNKFAENITINVEDLFSTFNVIAMKETTLGANQWLEDSQRIKFNNFEDLIKTESKSKETDDNEFIVNLSPMEIRSFILDVVYE